MKTIALIGVLAAVAGPVQDAPRPDSFAKLHDLIKPAAGEFSWYEDIPWLTSVQEARELAAASNKPLLIWCSADGQPCGAT
jgi:hypothetical protein